MKILIPTPLRSYTDDRGEVSSDGMTLGEMLNHLDRQYPGIRFRMIDEQERIRQHIKMFVNREQIFDLSSSLKPTDEIQIICALSGG